MRLVLKLCALCLASMASLVPVVCAQGGPDPLTGRVVLVLPFDNRSGNASLNWVRDSFPDTLNKRLNSAGFLTISRDDRMYAFDHLGLPLDFKPSRATAFRIAQQLDANMIVVGSFTVTDERIAIQARVLAVDGLTLSAPLEDGAPLNRLFDAENAVAWKVAKQIDPKFQVAEGTFLAAPGAVPLAALESYIRGITAPLAPERLQRLQTAVNIADGYAAALLALGKEQYSAHDYAGASKTLAQVPSSDPISLEANFYLGLARFNLTDYAGAEKAFGFVAARLPLSEVVNDQGVAVARQKRDASAFFRRVTASDPQDEDYHYNLAVSLYRHGEVAGATAEVETALNLRLGDQDAADLKAHLAGQPSGGRQASGEAGFSPVERLRRNYSEAGFRQAAFQIDQVRAMRMAMLPPAQAAGEYDALGQDYLAQGLLPEAERQFSSALEIEPTNAAAHAGLAQIREQAGDANSARDEANASNRLKPNVGAWLVLARVDLAAKQSADAARDVAEALRLEPANAAALAMKQALVSRGQTVGP